MRRVGIVLAGWTVVLFSFAAIFGGRQVAPCLALSCERFEQVPPPAPTPALVDPSLPWLWLGVWLAGCLIVLAIDRVGRV